mmetsp:Transcript_8448/g.9449  ORF Transcript_8448/g.9449 Transcript_8448/m.9449 type:complete len:194 (+) Transcript_8448:98-679(+)
MGCQAAASPLSMVGTPVPASGTPQAAPAFGVSASPAFQVPATFMPQVSGSAFTDVSSRMTGGSPVVYQSMGDQSAVQGYTSGSPVVYESGQALMMSGAAPMAVVPAPVPSLGASTPLSPVPAAFLSGHSVGTPLPVVPHATSDRMSSAAAKVPMPMPPLEDGTSTTMTTATKFSTTKAAKNKKKQKNNRCLCF